MGNNGLVMGIKHGGGVIATIILAIGAIILIPIAWSWRAFQVDMPVAGGV